MLYGDMREEFVLPTKQMLDWIALRLMETWRLPDPNYRGGNR